MLDLRGLQLQQDEREILMHPKVGGVILFTRNFASPEQLKALTTEIHELRQPHLLIAVDHEGGRVQRFREGFSRLPAAALIGRCRPDKAAQSVAEQTGWLMAAELLSVGVDLSFAPVLDVAGTISRVIGDRAFHAEPDVVSGLGKAFIHGMQAAGMSAVAKHFPGHGSVAEDSHVDIPYDQRAFEDIKMHDLIPFERMIHTGLPGLMPAHVIYAEVDRHPAGFSAVWLKHILRKQLGYQGAVFSDDLSMKGAEIMGGYPERAEAALHAGCDTVLVCNNREGAISILDSANIPGNIESCARLIRMHGESTTTLKELQQSQRWNDVTAVVTRLEKEPELELGDDIV